MIENKFGFKDELGQETETRKTYETDVIEHTPAIDLMVADFISHLRNCGFLEETIKQTMEEYIRENFPE